jgi:uncharacterized protein YjbI with pentapeptide repeats
MENINRRSLVSMRQFLEVPTMANANHLKVLLRGVDAWNAWRRKEPSVNPDLSGANLDSADLLGADLRRANLSEARLYEARFATFTKAKLTGAKLDRADLREVNLTEADLSEANLIAADLTRANLNSANLAGADLRGADLHGARLSGARLFNATFTKANLSGANLLDVDLSGANLSEAPAPPEQHQRISMSRLPQKASADHVLPLNVTTIASVILGLVLMSVIALAATALGSVVILGTLDWTSVLPVAGFWLLILGGFAATMYRSRVKRRGRRS